MVPVFICGCTPPEDFSVVLEPDVPGVEPVVPLPFGVAIRVVPWPAPLPPAVPPAPPVPAPPPAPCAYALPQNPKINAVTKSPFVAACIAVSLARVTGRGAHTNRLKMRRNCYATADQRVSDSLPVRLVTATPRLIMQIKRIAKCESRGRIAGTPLAH
jgi:hypothetical protein